MRQYTQEQFEELFDKLPEELQEAIFSVKTSEAVLSACENNGITDKRVSEVAKYTGQVLMGVVLASEFQEVLQKEVGLSKNVAKEIAREINRFVFYPMKPELDQIHDMEAGTAIPKATTQKTISEGKLASAPQKKDIYRETFEEEE